MPLSIEGLNSAIKKVRVERDFSDMPEITKKNIQDKIIAIRSRIVELQAELVNAKEARRSRAVEGFSQEVKTLENQIRNLEGGLKNRGIE